MANRNERQGQGRESRDRGERRDRDGAARETRAVYALSERGERTWWTRVGIGFVNADQSITIRLEAFPVSGMLQIRSDEPREEGGGS